MKYKCLVLDHDDTVVNSTKQIHYPAFLKALEVMRPDTTLTLEEYLMYNFDPGFIPYCINNLGFTEDEIESETTMWLEYVKLHIPTVFDGIKKVILKHKEEGGIVCVASHSHKENILRDYKENGLPLPDMVFGWEQLPEHRKPSPYPLLEIMREYNLKPQDLLMIDDLKPGFDMAKACNVDFAAAAWAYDIKAIKDFMRENCNYYFENDNSLYEFLFN